MKLIKAHINSFGNLKNLDINFSDKLNTIFHENGYGKTTFTIFLKAMFYGMAKKGNNKAYVAERSHYAPWQGGTYGGSLTIQIKDKIYTIIRQFANTPEGDTFELIDSSTRLKSNDYSKDIGFELFGVGMETFEITAFFSQNGLEKGVNDEVRANLTGANKFENDLASCSRAQKLIATAISNAKATMPKVNDIDELKRQIFDYENMQNFNKEELNKLQKQLKDLEENYQSSREEEQKLKRQYKEAVETKGKAQFLSDQIYSKNSKLESLKNQKIICLQFKENTVENKKTSFKIPILISIALLLFGASFIVASFFKFKSIFLTIGIVLAVMAVIVFGIVLIKRTGKLEQVQTLQNENLLKEIKLAQIEAEISSLEKEIFNAKKQFEQLEKIKNDGEIEQALDKFHQLDKNKSVLSIKINALKNELTQNEDNLAILNDNLAKTIENREKNAKKIEIFEKTKKFLSIAKENVSSRYLKPMQQSFDKLYSKFSTDSTLSMDINLQLNKVTESGLKESDYLSQGYKDLLSICRRLALLEQVFLEEKPFLILDDPFVNLDDEKLEVAKKLIKDLSKSYQIIYICSHSRCKI